MSSLSDHQASIRNLLKKLLRWKVILGWATLVGIFAIVDIYFIYSLFQLERTLDKVPHSLQNIPSLNQVEQASLRVNHAIQVRLVGDTETSLKLYRESSELLRKNLQQYLIHSNPESKQLNEILSQYIAGYLKLSQNLLSDPDIKKEELNLLVRELSTHLAKINEHSTLIRKVYQNVTMEKLVQIKQGVQTTSYFLMLQIPLLLGVTIYVLSNLNKGVLEPLASLKSSIQQIGQNPLQDPPVLSGKDFGVLAESFQEIAMQLRNYRENTTEQIARINKTMQATLACFPDPIFVLNLNGNIEFRNPAAEKFAVKLLLGGQTGLPPIVDDHLNRVLKTKQDYLPTKLQEALTFRMENGDQYHLPRVILLRNEKDAVFGVAIILEDVTNLRLLDDIKTNLVSTVSHELKTPLTSVRMAIYLLMEQMSSFSKKQQELLFVAKDDLERLLRILNNLLDLTWIEQAKPKLNIESCSLQELMKTAVSEVQDIANGKNLSFNVSTEPSLPSVKIDRQRSRPVITNFLTNAIKHSPRGGKIQLKAQKTSSGHIRISVQDQGPGIPKEHQLRIFEKFYRVPGQSKTGAGLGLSIAREIALAHGGQVGVISETGKGSEFYFEFPDFKDEEEEKAAELMS